MTLFVESILLFTGLSKMPGLYILDLRPASFFLQNPLVLHSNHIFDIQPNIQKLTQRFSRQHDHTILHKLDAASHNVTQTMYLRDSKGPTRSQQDLAEDEVSKR